MAFSGVRYILMDIEGTTSPIHFVKEVMFPYSAKKLPEFLKKNEANPQVQELMKDCSLKQLLQWVQEDVKHPSLKSLQGMIWKEAFETGEFSAPVYEEVLESWKNWKASGLTLGIYSSGSSTAQKMFFGHSSEGNLLPYLSHHFDLEVGPKQQRDSYENIADQLALTPKEILFLSDVPEELAAAEQAGFQVAHLVRPGTETSHYPSYLDFSQLDIRS